MGGWGWVGGLRVWSRWGVGGSWGGRGVGRGVLGGIGCGVSGVGGLGVLGGHWLRVSGGKLGSWGGLRTQQGGYEGGGPSWGGRGRVINK